MALDFADLIPAADQADDTDGQPQVAPAEAAPAPASKPEPQPSTSPALSFDDLIPAQSWPAALGNAAMQGVIGGTGSAMAGVGSIGSALENTAATKMLAAADAVAAGEMTPQAAMRDLTPTQRSMFSEWVTGTPEERVQWRAEMGKMLTAAPNALTSAGERVGHYGEEYKVDPGKEGWTTGGVRMAAGLVPMAAGAAAATVAGGPTAGGLVLASTIFGQSYDMALREARAKGLPPEQADQAAIQNATAQTAIMGVPMSRLLSAVPAPMREGALKTLINLGKHGVEFGSANALSRFVQNYVLREAGKPDQALTEGVMDAAAEGLIAGLIVPAAGGAVRAGARKVSDAIAPNASPELRRAMDEMEALAPETQPGRDAVPDVVRPPAAEATPPETGMPQTSTNEMLRQQAPEAAAEPAPTPEPPPAPKLRTVQEIIDQDGVSAKKAAEIQTAEIEAISRPVTAEEVAARKAGLPPPEARPEIPTMVVRPEPEAPQEGRPITPEDAMPEVHPGEDVGLAPAPEAPAVEPRAEAAPADAEVPKLDRPPPRPQDAISLLIQHGGIKDTGGDLKAMGADTIHHQRAGRLINNTRGMELDKARELLADYGYISHDTDINDLHSLIYEHLAGRPTYPAHYESERLAWEQGRAAESERNRAVDTLGDVRAVADEAGVTLTAAEQEHAARLILQGEAPHDAVYEAVRAGDADAQQAFNEARGMLSKREQSAADKAAENAPSPEAGEARRRLATVMQAVMRYLGVPSDVGLRLVDRLASEDGASSDAAYTRDLITFALDTAAVRGPHAVPEKLFHEVVHALLDPKLGVLTTNQTRALLTAADRWLAEGNNRDRLERMGYTPEQMREEAVARWAEEVLAKSRDAGPIGRRALDAMNRAVQAIGNGLRGQGFRSADGVLRAVMQGKVKAPEGGAARGPQQDSKREGITDPKFAELMRRNREARERADVYAAAGKPARFKATDGRLSYLVSPDMHYPREQGMWRVTAFDQDNMPLGHMEFTSARDAFLDVVRNTNNKPVGANHPEPAKESRREPLPPKSGPDLFGRAAPAPRERQAEPTIKNDQRQETMFGPGSAVQAQAARDQSGRGALTAKAPQQAADQGLFAPPKPPQDRLFSKREDPPKTVAEGVRRLAALPVIARATQATTAKASDLASVVRMAVAPMAEGSKETMAQAKDYANLNRLARHEASMLTSWLDKTYTPEQRRRMWEAADEQSVAMQQGQPTEGIGLDRLTPQERAVVQQLQALSDDAFQQARQLGMIESDGLPSYVPRMVVEMVDGVARPITDKQARNLPGTMEATRTSTPHLRHREHLTTEETERAARAALDNPNVAVARDISTLPLATMKLQQAIAGRVLINQIREAGRRSGEQAVAEGAEPQDGFKWFTIRENPAFWTWRVRDGQDGAKIMEKVPLYIRGDYEGPLRAVLTDRSGGALYKAWMALKGRMMTAIMWGVVHGTVIAGRISPKSPNLVRLYREGATLREDPAAMREFIMSGGVPVGHDFGYQDISGALNEGVPSNRYMSTIAARWVAGDKAANAVERANDFVHNTLTWDTIGKWQMGMFQQVKRAEIAKGADPQTAARMAAHVANRLAGAMPAEAMSAFAQKAANLLLFSRSYRIGGAGQIKDLLNGLPRDVRAQIERDQGPQAALNAQARGRRIARSVLLADLGIYVASNSLLQSAANVLLNDGSIDEEAKGYVRRLLDQGKEVASHPTKLLNPFWVLDLPEKLMSTSDNEPGKHARILVGREEDGTGIYVRNPAGKFPEDIFDYIQRPVQTLNRITSPFVRLGLGIFGNNKGFNRPIHDPYSGLDQSFLSNAVDIAKFVAEGVTPFTSLIEPVVDLAKKGVGVKTGNSAAMDVGKLLGSAFGVTISKGFPGGPEKGETFAVDKKYRYDVAKQMPAIREAIKTGQIEKAVDMMIDLKMEPREQSRVFDSVRNPSRVSPGQMRRFQMRAPDEAKERVERGRERQGIAP